MSKCQECESGATGATGAGVESGFCDDITAHSMESCAIGDLSI